MVDMRHKLCDIQTNKMFLEKKIQEYEKKLNEIKGMPKTDENNQASNIQKSKTLTKINTLSASILEKVLSESRR